MHVLDVPGVSHDAVKKNTGGSSTPWPPAEATVIYPIAEPLIS